MNRIKSIANLFTALILIFTLSCTGQSVPEISIQDQTILKQVFGVLIPHQQASTAELTALCTEQFIGSPYAAHTLEKEPEQLVIDLHEFDCTTLAESCLAIARCVKMRDTLVESFARELQLIRYRQGKIEDYTSRLHYFSEWIVDNREKNILSTFSPGETFPHEIHFMSSHPQSYAQLKSNPQNMAQIQRIEKRINAQELRFIPKEHLTEYEPMLDTGDIVGFTTNIKGLDIAHVGILLRKGRQLFLLHASSSAQQVVQSKQTLANYLSEHDHFTGIMVARPAQ